MGTRKNKSNKRFRKTRSKRGGGKNEQLLLEWSEEGTVSGAGMQSLLKQPGIDVNARNRYGITPLQFAIKNGHTEIVAMLLDAGADVNTKNNDGHTALILASENEHTEIVAMLLEKGADVNMKVDDGHTALTLASYNGHTEIARLIRNHIKHKNLRDARLVTEKGKKEDGTPLLPRARRDVATMVAPFIMGGKRKTRKYKKSKRKNRKTRRK